MTARTRGRVVRLASEHGWLCQTPESNPLVDLLVKGPRLVRVRYARNGRLAHVAHYAHDGRAETPERGKLAFLRGWLTA